MADATFLFIDFDDTLSDFAEHGRQYVHELSALLASDVGGDPSAWQAALQPALNESMARYAAQFGGKPVGGFAEWVEEERLRVAEQAFAAVGQSPPAGESLGSFAKRLQFDALTACDAAFPGAGEALRRLFEAGVRVQIASSQESEYLMAALIGAGIESYTESKFGPDLVDCPKEGPEFYQRIFSACGVAPSQAIVVDDQAMCLDWAEEAGARVVQACIKPSSAPEFPVVLTTLADLPDLVERISTGR